MALVALLERYLKVGKFLYYEEKTQKRKRTKILRKKIPLIFQRKNKQKQIH